MRSGWYFPGVILMLITLVLVYVPLPYPQSATVDDEHPLILYCPQVLPTSSQSSSLCFSGQSPIDVSWSGGNATTWVQFMPCNTFSCSDINNTITPNPKVISKWGVVAEGASGTLHIAVPTNTSFIIVTNSTNYLSIQVTWNAMPEFHVLWEAFALFGMVITVVGLLLPQKPRAKAPSNRPPPVSEPYNPHSEQTEESEPHAYAPEPAAEAPPQAAEPYQPETPAEPDAGFPPQQG
jgi:hypothetical protein